MIVVIVNFGIVINYLLVILLWHMGHTYYKKEKKIINYFNRFVFRLLMQIL